MDVQIISKKKEFDPNSKCGAEDCIKELVIFAHGQYFDQYQMSTIYFMDGSISNNISENDIMTEIPDFINNANIKFCSEETLDIRSCNIGKNKQIKERIEKCYEDRGYKIEVKIYSYPIFFFWNLESYKKLIAKNM